jgi:hypothetical protein
VNFLQQQDCRASPVAALLASGHEQVQSARIDSNINQKDTTWFRFQSDTGMQAVWTDPINPVFGAISAAHTHVFSQSLVNYFSELLQSRILLVGKPVRAKRPPENTFGFPDRIAGQRREPLYAYNCLQLTAMKRLGDGLQG